ncbi:MAG: 3-dehydroquinate synthase [Chitinophagales bacterium]
MKQLRVDLGQRSYNIAIKEGILSETGKFLKQVTAQDRVMLVTNPTVHAFYGNKIMESLIENNFRVVLAEVPDGEKYKTVEQLEKVIDLAVDNKFDRGSLLLTLGGGVIGDLGGFAAAIYQRGIDFVQIPTTLLAQVDSSVGGKVAVNHPRAKNMIGAFHQPRLVIIDPETIRTLPDREYRAGLAEVVKYGIINDEDFFRYLEDNTEPVNERDLKTIKEVIAASCRIKSEIVENDEREGGQRALLNLGHTFGHAIENRAGYGTYSHGEAVAIGISLASSLAHQIGILSNADEQRIKLLLKNLHIDTTMPDYPTKDLVDTMYQDKKILGGKLRLVLPDAIGHALILEDISRTQIEDIISISGRKL